MYSRYNKNNINKFNNLQIKLIKNFFLKLSVLVICLFFSLCIFYDESYATSSSIPEKYTKACELALETVQYVNQENLEVRIGDIYNVIDTDGKLDGYALGYYVDDEPYGYAIYNLHNKSIREFVFKPGVNNIYVELEEKAEETNDVDEDNLISGIVYDGGIDYGTYDYDGNKVELIEECVQDEEIEETSSYDEETEKIINSRYVNGTESVYNKDIGDMFQNNTYGSIYNANTFNGWNIVPDSGLTMITTDYSIQHCKKYCCSTQSIVGILNWMGRLYNGNIVDSYNKFWIDCDIKKTGEEGGVTYGSGITYLDVNALNNYFKSLEISTMAYADYDLTFNEILNQIQNGEGGERNPISLRIYLTKTDSATGKSVTNGHAVTAISYIKTTSKNYVGIYNGWGLDENDNQVDESGLKSNVGNETSYQSVRYIDYDEMKKCENVRFDAIMFKNVQSANIKEAKTEYASSNSIELSCQVPYGTKHVFFPTWTVSSNGADVKWHEGQIQYGTRASVSIDLNAYNKASGIYVTHIYAYDENMNQLAYYGTLYNNIESSISNVRTTNKTIKGYTYTCDLPTGTARVEFPTWSGVNGQDDLIWYGGNIINNNGKKQGKITIDVANHKNDGGVYYTHIYAYDKYNKLIATYMSGSITITDRKQIADAKVTNITSNSYKVTCKIPTGTAYVWFPTWTYNNGQDDLICYDAVVNGETAYLTIYKSKHNNESGLYVTHIYAYNSKNENLGFKQLTVNMD